MRVPQFIFVLVYYQYKMTQYITLNVKLSSFQLNGLESEIYNGTDATFIKCCWYFQ